MEVYRSEQEQVEEIKKWWAEYGNTIITGLLLGIAILVGFKYWQGYKSDQATQASAIYNQMLTSLRAGDEQVVAGKALQLVEQYNNTSYAPLAALIQARMHVEANEYDKAAEQLNWVIDNAKQDGIVNVARLRLARIQLAKGEANAALAVIEQSQPEGFEPAYEALKGDIYLQLNDKDKAMAAYKKALASDKIGNEIRTLLQMKLKDL